MSNYDERVNDEADEHAQMMAQSAQNIIDAKTKALQFEIDQLNKRVKDDNND